MKLNPEYSDNDDDSFMGYDPEDNLKFIDSLDNLPEEIKEEVKTHAAKIKDMKKELVLDKDDQYLTVIAFLSMQISMLQQSVMGVQKAILKLAAAHDDES